MCPVTELKVHIENKLKKFQVIPLLMLELLAFLGMGETTSSFSWFHKDAKTFVTGMNGKILRIYDIRGKSRSSFLAGY